MRRFLKEAGIFHGEVSDTKDVITLQGKSVDEIKTAFRESIDDYLDFCALCVIFFDFWSSRFIRVWDKKPNWSKNMTEVQNVPQTSSLHKR